MNELTVTVVGWVATDVRVNVGRSGASVGSFRLASTPRYFDRARETWVDGATQWFTVRVFRGAAMLVKSSIRTGQPVLVTGRMREHTWEAQDGPRTELVIEATAVGHDCTRGVATFVRATGDVSLAGDGTASGEALEAARADEAAAGADGQMPPGEAEDLPDVEDEPVVVEEEPAASPSRG